MKKFIKNLLLFGVLFFFFDKIFIVFLAISPTKEIDKRLESVLNGKLNKEIIVLGSSRGARNIIASEIEKKTGHSAYNLSYPGSDIEFHEFIIRSLVKYNKTPKAVILSLDYPMAFLPDSILNFRLDRMYPLVKYNYINDELVARGEKNKLMSYLFALHRMNKSNIDIRQKKFSALDTIFPDGSMPISFQRHDEDWSPSATLYKYNKKNELKVKLECFKKIRAICKEKNIKLILVLPPFFDTMDPKFKERVLQLSENNSDFFEFNHQNPIYKSKDYYYDRTHLNNKGAKIFSNELADYLNGIKL